METRTTSMTIIHACYSKIFLIDARMLAVPAAGFFFCCVDRVQLIGSLLYMGQFGTVIPNDIKNPIANSPIMSPKLPRIYPVRKLNAPTMMSNFCPSFSDLSCPL